VRKIFLLVLVVLLAGCSREDSTAKAKNEAQKKLSELQKSEDPKASLQIALDMQETLSREGLGFQDVGIAKENVVDLISQQYTVSFIKEQANEENEKPREVKKTRRAHRRVSPRPWHVQGCACTKQYGRGSP